MKVLWTERAHRDRVDIVEFIATESPSAAQRIDTLLGAVAASLATFPARGRPGAIAGTRELIPYESYRLVYEIDGDRVLILAVVHTARQWPPER